MAGIKVTIGGSVAGLKAALNQAESRVQNFGKKVKGFFGGIGGMLAGAGLGMGFKRIVDDLDMLSKRARGLGITAEEMQKLEYAAQSANVPVENLGEVLPKAAKLAADALGGNAGAIARLDALGISLEDIRGANPYQIFELIARGVSQIEDPAQRITAVMNALGESMAKNVQFFLDFKGNTENLAASGRLIRDEDALAAEQINQSLTDAAKAIRAILVDTGALAKLAKILDNYAAFLGEDELRERTGVKQTWQSKAWDIAENAEAWFMPWTRWTGSSVRGVRDFINGGSTLENYAAALPLTRSTTSLAAQQRRSASNIAAAVESGEVDDTEYLAAMDEMAAAVQTLATATNTAGSVAGSPGPRSAMRGGDDPTFSDALRRIGGDAGGVYRQGDNYARTTAEATKAMAENIDAMNRNGLILRG